MKFTTTIKNEPVLGWECNCVYVTDKFYEAGEDICIPRRCPEHGAPFHWVPYDKIPAGIRKKCNESYR